MSVYRHVMVLGYELKARQNFFLLFRQCFLYRNTEFDDDQMSKYAAQMLEVIKWTTELISNITEEVLWLQA